MRRARAMARIEGTVQSAGKLRSVTLVDCPRSAYGERTDASRTKRARELRAKIVLGVESGEK